jgi:hypothetical protein
MSPAPDPNGHRRSPSRTLRCFHQLFTPRACHEPFPNPSRARFLVVVPGGVPWSAQEGGAAFICVVPDYDRHFAMCENFGTRMIPLRMHDDGPDIEAVRRLVAENQTIKGMWCVPKYSSPTGTVYSDEVVEALASMQTAAPDFRLF